MSLINKKDKALLFAFFSQNDEEYERSMNELLTSPFYMAFALFIHYLIHKEDFMILKKKDKELSKRLNKAFEDIIEDFDIDIRLKNIPLEKILKRVPTEDRLKGVPTEDRLKGVPSEEKLKDVPTEEMLKRISLEGIKKYLHRLNEDIE